MRMNTTSLLITDLCILVFDINYKHGVINIFSPKQKTKAELSFVLYIMGKYNQQLIYQSLPHPIIITENNFN